VKAYNVKEFTAPTTEPISEAEAKLHCRVDHTTEDAIFTRLIPLARRQCEQISKWAFVTRTYKAKLDRWPWGNEIKLLYPPLQSVTSIVYIDEDDGSNTFASSNYVVDIHSTPGRIVLKEDADWPSENLQVGGAITITYVAGFGNAASVPDQYKQAMLLLIGHLYENRESVSVQQGIGLVQIPQAVEWLLLTDRAY
jgi:uncharacterized phiE125 gp8 family phage protein